MGKWHFSNVLRQWNVIMLKFELTVPYESTQEEEDGETSAFNTGFHRIKDLFDMLTISTLKRFPLLTIWRRSVYNCTKHLWPLLWQFTLYSFLIDVFFLGKLQKTKEKRHFQRFSPTSRIWNQIMILLTHILVLIGIRGWHSGHKKCWHWKGWGSREHLHSTQRIWLQWMRTDCTVAWYSKKIHNQWHEPLTTHNYLPHVFIRIV